jgi:beta-galactosidase
MCSRWRYVAIVNTFAGSYGAEEPGTLHPPLRIVCLCMSVVKSGVQLGISRRAFLRGASAIASGVVSRTAGARLLPASLAYGSSSASTAPSQILADGWEGLRMPLSGPWEVWLDPPLAPWAPLSLPHCVNAGEACDPDTPAYRGSFWYRRHLSVDNPFAEGRTLLHFEGASQSAQIYIGNRLVASHIGGYDEFVVDISESVADPAARDSHGIRLAILCDNAPDLERMPSDLSDFTLYGGLYRNVHLVYAPALSLAMVHVEVHAGIGKPAQVAVRARLYNPSRQAGQVKVTVMVTDPSGAVVYRTQKQLPAWEGERELVGLSLTEPELWSPETPRLYACEVSVHAASGESTQLQRFGVRFYEFQEYGPFLLNGQRLLIRGTHRHEDHAGCAAAMPAALIREEMRMIREMGANFIRLAHYQQQRLVLDLCDELGLMVWEETPWCRAGVGDAAFQQQGREKLTTMIDQHSNHPSIILWGLGNEDDWPGEYPSIDHEAIRAYMTELRDLARQLDPTRLTSFRRCDFARDIPDVYSPSIWAGWYAGRYVDYEAALVTARAATPHFLHVEWGADSLARRHAEDPYQGIEDIAVGETAERGLAYLPKGGTSRVSRDGDWSETYACDLFDWHLKVQESLPWLTGAVQWIFKDFTTPLRVENPVPRINLKGVVERDLTKKEGYYVFQSYWAAKPMVHIYGHSWPVRWGNIGDSRVVKVYSNCATAELFLNGVSLGVRHRDMQNFPAAGLRWQVAFRGGANRLRVVAHAIDGLVVTDEVTLSYQPGPWGAPTAFRMRVIGRPVTSGTGTVTVEATLHDPAGLLCLDARNVVRFTIAGSGQLIDNQGTSTGSRVIELYNGRVQISVAGAGPDTVIALHTDGLPTVLCSLGAEAAIGKG